MISRCQNGLQQLHGCFGGMSGGSHTVWEFSATQKGLISIPGINHGSSLIGFLHLYVEILDTPLKTNMAMDNHRF